MTTLATSSTLTPVRTPREGIRPPKFADKFALLDFEGEPMPVISMFEPPAKQRPDQALLFVRGEDLRPRITGWDTVARLPQVEVTAPLVCQIFNWYQEVTWTGVRLRDFLDAVDLPVHEEGYYAFHSADGEFFETISRDEAVDPRVLLATGMNGIPLPHEYGGPVRLVVPFLQGYKSVKWVRTIQAFRHDPIGIKRLLGQSKTARLGQAWMDRLNIVPAEGRPGDP